jgi:hypothetical protein
VVPSWPTGVGIVTDAGSDLLVRKRDTTPPTLGKSPRVRWLVGTRSDGFWWPVSMW